MRSFSSLEQTVMVVTPKVYERLAEIQTELLRSGSHEPTGDTVALMREGVSALRQFQGVDAQALTTWNEWRREPWLED